MRKTIRNGIDRRAVYKFQCTGSCGRVKATYVYERAKKGICLTCSKHAVDPNQGSLFEAVEAEPGVRKFVNIETGKTKAILDSNKGEYQLNDDNENPVLIMGLS